MNIEDMKAAWAEHDRKLDSMLQLNLATLRDMRVNTARWSLRRLASGVVIELAITVLALLLLGNFISLHLDEPRFFVPALVVHLSAIALAGSCALQVAMIGSLDYAGPVVSVQKELGKLRILRVRTTKWTFILACVLWAPILVVVARGAIGVDLYMIASAVNRADANFYDWLVANVLFGAAVAIALLWISRRFPARFASSPIVKSFMDDIAGRSLTAAVESLESITTFERGTDDGSSK
ncbi:MAG: hypothetical protein WC538_14775 [Thermoanaerobaculia bacterium]|jgi:hypothetical protein